MGQKPESRESKSGLKRPATLKDIAAIAGVSATTVSNVLLDRAGNYSKETADEIRRLAKEMGYRRNSLARSLVTRRSNTLGLVIEEKFNISHPENIYFVSFLQVFMKHAEQRQHHVKLIQHQRQDTEMIIAQINDGSVDGVVGLVLSPDNKLNHWLSEQAHLPSVLVGGDHSRPSPSTLDIDDAPSMAAVARHLLDLGHQRMWFVNGLDAHPSLEARQQGFADTVRAAGIDMGPECWLRTDMEGQKGSKIVRKYLETPPEKQPTAIACVNDLIALAVIQSAANAGLRIPEQCSVTGFDGFPRGEWSTPSLTTIRQPFPELGHRAAEILVAGADGDSAVHHEVFPGELVVRDSTGHPPPAK